MTTVPLDGGTVTDVCDPGTVTDSVSLDGGTVTVLDGISVTVPGVVPDARSPFAADLRAETLTFKLVFASSLLRLITTKKTISRIAPIRPSGMKIQFGTPSFR